MRSSGGSTCDWLTDPVVAWFQDTVRQAVTADFDLYIVNKNNQIIVASAQQHAPDIEYFIPILRPHREQLQVAAGTHPDLFIARRPEESLELPIEVMRELCQGFALKSARGRGKIVILDDADDLNEEAPSQMPHDRPRQAGHLS